MNERIQQLARVAGATDEQGRKATDVFCFTAPELERFAELIVQECAELATKEYNNRGAIHGNDLLQHFGVEQ
jgi:hypothetical protein